MKAMKKKRKERKGKKEKERKEKKRKESIMEGEEQKHYVLVHGACHGAWCWYKVKPLLEKAGHRVTALDLAASGVHPKQIDGLDTIHDYSEPLIKFLESIPDDDQKVILVGHSLGGLNLAIAIQLFSHKIHTAVFLAAFMPDTKHNPRYVFDEYVAKAPEGNWLDTEFKSLGDPNESLTTMFFGPKFISKLYHLSPLEDFELAMMLKRPSSFFLHDLGKANNFSDKKRKGLKLVYVVCTEDIAIPKDYQIWMAKNNGLNDHDIIHLQGADHMPMFSMPQQLSNCFIDIAKSL